jgi:hypothetical protein
VHGDGVVIGERVVIDGGEMIVLHDGDPSF